MSKKMTKKEVVELMMRKSRVPTFFNLLAENSSPEIESGLVENRYYHCRRVGLLCVQIFLDEIKGDMLEEYEVLSVNEYFLVGMLHDICKLGSKNHAEEAYRVLTIKNEDPQSDLFGCLNDELLLAIRHHSLKFTNVITSKIGGVLKDADILDKLSLDSIFKSLGGANNINSRLEKLYLKKAVLSEYKFYTKAGKKIYNSRIKLLNKMISEEEKCRD